MAFYPERLFVLLDTHAVHTKKKQLFPHTVTCTLHCMASIGDSSRGRICVTVVKLCALVAGGRFRLLERGRYVLSPESSNVRGDADSKKSLKLLNMRGVYHFHPKHDLEGIRSRNPTIISMR